MKNSPSGFEYSERIIVSSHFPTGANVFCFLSSSPLLPPAATIVFESYCHLSTVLITNIVFPMRACLYPYDGIGFVGPQKEDECGPLSVESGIFGNTTIKDVNSLGRRINGYIVIKGAYAWECKELAFFTLGDPVWVGDLGSEAKKHFFSFAPDFNGFWFFTACWVFYKLNFF
jgi:hypothetical protein